MAGQKCDGRAVTAPKNAKIKNSKALCDGALARTLEVTPTNPHQAGSETAAAWDAGVAIKADADGDPPCCAPAGAAAT